MHINVIAISEKTHNYMNTLLNIFFDRENCHMNAFNSYKGNYIIFNQGNRSDS